ncbi:MAG: outer membrane lipoprotein-sorting protein [Saprospiraceae bacterium]|jgi:outer membrane lipoprotein-sorting protein
MKNSIKIFLVLLIFPQLRSGQAFVGYGFDFQTDPTGKEILQKADEKVRGKTSQAEIKMTIVRPKYTREVVMKSWSSTDDYSLILVTSPARDKGTAFLKREKEMWNWQPTIDRVIKMPPSMMTQSWMGSDFTNDDLVRESSIVKDYTSAILESEVIEGYDCYKIRLIPKPEAPVVWGKVITWISKEEYMQLKTEFYDEDDYLVNTMKGKNIKEIGGKLLPAVLEVIPADEEGNKTMIEYLSLDFDKPIEASFFSIQNMKRVR